MILFLALIRSFSFDRTTILFYPEKRGLVDIFDLKTAIYVGLIAEMRTSYVSMYKNEMQGNVSLLWKKSSLQVDHQPSPPTCPRTVTRVGPYGHQNIILSLEIWI